MKICPLLKVACALSSPGTGLFWNCAKPVTMPLTDSLPNGPASKVAGGSHCSGPVRTNVESGAGAGAGGVAGIVGACAPDIKAIAIAAPAIDCSKRYGFIYIDTVPSKKNGVCCMTKRNLAKDGGKKHGTLSVQSPNLRGHSGHTVYSASPSRARFRSSTLTRGSPKTPSWRLVMC